MTRSTQLTFGSMVRATTLVLLAVIAGAVMWRLRPSPSVLNGPPDAAIVTGCAWLAWVLANYLAIAVATSALAQLATGGGIAANALARVAPGQLRRVIEATVTVGFAASLAAGAAPAGAVEPGLPAAGSGPAATAGSALDWPGLAAPSAPPVDAPNRPVVVQPQPSRGVVVRPGDTLWAIAAGHLDAAASDGEITVAWHPGTPQTAPSSALTQG